MQIRWTLQLLEGEAAQWRDEQLEKLDCGFPPNYLTYWADFLIEFCWCWMDPHEGEKALDRLQKGEIQQITLVKKYNDQFNDALSLTGLTGANAAIAQAYVSGLKGLVWAYAFAPLHANPNTTFQECQALMVDVDEELQQTQPQCQYNPAPHPCVVMNNPVISAGQPTRTPATLAPWGQTLIKVEAVHQYTQLTPEECEELCWTGGCFCCCQQGHMSHQCPHVTQVVAVTPVPTDPAPC